MNCRRGRRASVLYWPQRLMCKPSEEKKLLAKAEETFYVTQVEWWRSIFPSDKLIIALLKHPENLLLESH